MTILNVFLKKKGLKYAQKTDFIVSEIFFFQKRLNRFCLKFSQFYSLVLPSRRFILLKTDSLN